MLHLRRPALASTVPDVRRVVGRWLAQNGASKEEGYEMLVAFAEAYSNAVQHAYGSGEGRIDIEATIDEREVSITVRDFGAWRARDSSVTANGGRGLPLMEKLMDDVDISSGSEGTSVRMRRTLGAVRTR